MAKGPAKGYVYGIKDPETGQYIFVGNGTRPWESVMRHIQDSSNPQMKAWAEDLFRKYPEGIEILGEIVCHRYHGDMVEYPDPAPGITRLEWDILGEEVDTEGLNEKSGGVVVPMRTTKAYWIERLLNEGHPLFNKQPGRPPRMKITLSNPPRITAVAEVESNLVRSRN